MRARALPTFGALAVALVIAGACGKDTAVERVINAGEGRLTTLVERRGNQQRVCLLDAQGSSMPPVCGVQDGKNNPRLEGSLAEKLAQQIPFRTALVDLTIRRKSEEVWELERFEVVDDFRDAMGRARPRSPRPAERLVDAVGGTSPTSGRASVGRSTR